MVEKRAASCDIDPSITCECTNPFLGTDNFFLGEAARLCESAKSCYVKNLSGCADSRQSRGGGRCLVYSYFQRFDEWKRHMERPESNLVSGNQVHGGAVKPMRS